MATLSQSRPTAGHRSQQLQRQTSRPRALQQCQSVLLLLRHGLDHEVPAGFIAWRRVPSTANAGTITKSQHFHFDGGTRPPTTSTKISAGRAPVGRRWCWCLCWFRLVQLRFSSGSGSAWCCWWCWRFRRVLKGVLGPPQRVGSRRVARTAVEINWNYPINYASKFGLEAPLAA